MVTLLRLSSIAAMTALACAFAATPVMAASSTAKTTHKAPTAQQLKMGTCNKEAKGKHGAEHKTFMHNCLSKHGSATASSPQQRMKTCNADAKAKALKGPQRKAFMSSCLKKH
ncbi:MAG: PsiF family protein [Xanthomonadales bacterium]|nr:PsiF family protein [Xanthomonadales bacterium]